MTLGSQIAFYRKSRNITQEALAQQLGVTNQAVSKWESEQCCPDVTLLPKLADIFGITVDALFGRSVPHPEDNAALKLPWEDDETLRVMLFAGRRLMENHPAAEKITVRFNGPALSIVSAFSVTCAAVAGNIMAGGSVNCEDVTGNIMAGSSVSCGDVEGSVEAGGDIACGDVEGSVEAGGDVSCGDVEGSVEAGGDIACGDVDGDVHFGGTASFGSIGGSFHN